MARLHDRHTDIIDLVSSGDDDGSPGVKQELLEDDNQEYPYEEDVDMQDVFTLAPAPTLAPQGFAPAPHAPWEPVLGGTIFVVDGEQVFIPDEVEVVAGPAPPPEPEVEMSRDEELALALANEYEAADAQECNNRDVAQPGQPGQPIEVNADYCLQRVLAIFPDISHDYVFNLFNDFEREGDYQVLAGDARLENIIEQLVTNPSYPKQEKGKKALKRKREDSIEDTDSAQWENADRMVEPGWPKHSAQSLLKAEFPDIPIHFIHSTLNEHKHLYQTYLVLNKAQEDISTTRRYGKGRASIKVLADADTIALNSHWPPLMEELEAARMKVMILKSEKEALEVVKKAEKDNLARAIAAGETAECTACFDDLPMNRQIHCDGDVAHFVCFDCALTYIKSEVGESRCRVVCTAGCGAGFAIKQLALLSDTQLLEKLSQLQQEKDIRDANLDDLEECPFCDYKAILPPIEEDFEFRCPNPECEKVSCRRCKSISHIPMSCEEHAKDNKVNSRHKIEEAMTTALIRKCNKCSKSFIKEYGCNKMACTSCGNLQCYVCSKTVKDYNHFDQSTRVPGMANPKSKSKLCPLYDNVEERHEREVKEAEAAARAQVVEDNPDLTAEDLEIKVSDAVKKSNKVPAGAVAGMADPFGVFGAVEGLFNYEYPELHPYLHRRRNHNAGPLARAMEARHRREDLEREQEDARQFLLGMRPPYAPPIVPPAVPVQARPGPQPAQPLVQGRVQGYIPVIGFPHLPAAQYAPYPRAVAEGAAARAPEANPFRPDPADVFGFMHDRHGQPGPQPAAQDNNNQQNNNARGPHYFARLDRLINPDHHAAAPPDAPPAYNFNAAQDNAAARWQFPYAVNAQPNVPGIFPPPTLAQQRQYLHLEQLRTNHDAATRARHEALQQQEQAEQRIRERAAREVQLQQLRRDARAATSERIQEEVRQSRVARLERMRQLAVERAGRLDLEALERQVRAGRERHPEY